MGYHVSIDYDEGIQNSYRGIVIKMGDDEVRFMTGDPVADWSSYIEYGKEHKLSVSESSSITHFVFDNIEWRFVEGEDGHEYLVPEDRPAYLDLIAYRKAGSPELPELLDALKDEPCDNEPDIYYLAEAMGFNDGTEFEYLPSEAGLRDWFTTKWISRWICSDTTVGSRVVYYEGEPFAIENKPFRKAKPEFTFICTSDLFGAVYHRMQEVAYPKPDFESLKRIPEGGKVEMDTDYLEELTDPIRSLMDKRVSDQEAPSPSP